jgi:retron-type reverse transcriptase
MSMEQALPLHLRRCKYLSHRSRARSAYRSWKLEGYSYWDGANAKSLLSRIADYGMLELAWQRVASASGSTPGVDGRTAESYSNAEKIRVLNALSKDIQRKHYQAGPDRKGKIPKASGIGFRNIMISNWIDRVAGKATQMILAPILDRTFMLSVHGSRIGPGQTRQMASTKIWNTFDPGKRVYWVKNDLKDAFDNVHVPQLIDLLGKELNQEDLVQFLGAMLTRADEKKGLRQGHPASPLLMNFYLHKLFDQHARKRIGDHPYVRYVDDLLFVTPTLKEAREVYRRLARTVVPLGFQLKYPEADSIIRYTRSSTTQTTWLGYDFRRTRRKTTLQIADRSWEKLTDGLKQLAKSYHGYARVHDVIFGWLEQQKVTFEFEKPDFVINRIFQIANNAGFTELSSQDELERRMLAASLRSSV